MKPPAFEYYDPTSVGEAVSLLEQYGGEAKALAGGQSLMPLLNMRLARPQAIVDLNRVAELDYIRESGGGLAIGALTRQRTVERSDVVKRVQPLLHAATLYIGHPQIRNRGTVGGSLAHADPAGELPAVARALGAELRTVGPQGERTIAADEFFVSFLTSALEPDEVLTEVRIPSLPPRTGWAFLELARRHGDFALAGVAVTLTLDGPTCREARIALFGVAPTPLRASQAEQLLAGEAASDELFEAAGRRAGDEIEEPLSDIHASADFRRHLASLLTRRALVQAAARARDGGSG